LCCFNYSSVSSANKPHNGEGDILSFPYFSVLNEEQCLEASKSEPVEKSINCDLKIGSVATRAAPAFKAIYFLIFYAPEAQMEQ
jgi:hypothetical protein